MNIEELVDNFALFDDWEGRYGYLIELGKNLPPMEDALKTSHTLVRGCMSQVWMVTGWDAEGRLTIQADSDAQIVQGLIFVLRAMFAGKRQDEIKKINVELVFQKLGLDQHLSPNRRNGFFSMVEKIREFTSRQTG
jgi:cysteine desulfuration protein SufE